MRIIAALLTLIQFTNADEETWVRNADHHSTKSEMKKTRRKKEKMPFILVPDGGGGDSRRIDTTLLPPKKIKDDWCKGERFRMEIKAEGCTSRKIRNRLCYGQCNSFYIPNDDFSDPSAVFATCSTCKPSKTSFKSITMVCPGQVPRKQRRRVTIVKDCQCIAIPEEVILGEQVSPLT